MNRHFPLGFHPFLWMIVGEAVAVVGGFGFHSAWLVGLGIWVFLAPLVNSLRKGD